MKDLFEKVGKFNEAFGIAEHKEFGSKIPDEGKLLYAKLLGEELNEYIDAVITDNKVEVADAWTDMLFVLIGMGRKHGLDVDTADKLFDEVYRSNMSKLDEDGKPIYREDGKVLKGPNFFNPDLAKFL